MERTGSSSRKPSEQAPEQDASNQNTEDDVTMLFHSAGSRGLYDSQSPGNGPEEEYSQAAVVYDDPDRDERQRMIAQLQLDNVEGGRAGDELDEEGAGTEAATYVQAASAAGSPAASTAGDGKGKRKFSETGGLFFPFFISFSLSFNALFVLHFFRTIFQTLLNMKYGNEGVLIT